VTALDLTLREMRDEDRNYVLSSWLLSYENTSRRARWVDPRTREVVDGGGEFRSMPRAMYFRLYEPIVESLLRRSTVVIAALPEADDAIVSWFAAEGDVLHYVHTKNRFRKLGAAAWLLRDALALPVTYTHEPRPFCRSLIGAAWTYDPMRRFERKAA
jgi:hypothetical protein